MENSVASREVKLSTGTLIFFETNLVGKVIIL